LAVGRAHPDYHPSCPDLALNVDPVTGVDRPSLVGGSAVANESSQSAVSWAAIFSGALATVSITLVLLALGAGLGLSSISPWPNSGASAATFTIMTAIGLIVVQWLAAAIGGFLTGRLRTKWVAVHVHEVFFRDTAHGFLTWALATVIGLLLAASAASSIIGGGVHAAATVAGGAAQGAGQIVSQAASGVSAYDVDSLFRSDHPNPADSSQDNNAQVTRILASGVANGDVPAADRTYLAQLVAARTGISQADAEKRVDEVIAREKAAVEKAKQAADAARKAAAQFAIFTALSMMIGAFIASAAAAYGGSMRDEY
jgi:hypothetical protein